MAFKLIKPTIWSPAKDEAIEGELMEVEHGAGKFAGIAYHIKCTDGRNLIVFGNKVLNDLMKFLKPGAVVQITYKGKKVGKDKQEYHDYQVAVDDGVTA